MNDLLLSIVAIFGAVFGGVFQSLRDINERKKDGELQVKLRKNEVVLKICANCTTYNN